MFDARFFRERSLLYRRTKLLCPVGHGIKAVTGLADDGDARLECGCLRSAVLPLAEGRMSVEHLDSFSSEATRRFAQQLFPIVAPHHEWELGFAI